MKYLFLIAVTMMTACGPIIIPTKPAEVGPIPVPQQATTQQSALAKCTDVNMTTFNGPCTAPDGSTVQVNSGGNTGTVTVS